MITVPTAGQPMVGGAAIRQVSALLRVPASTLRSWERRYGIPVTARTVGGHRRYAESELIQLRLMRDEIARGRRASDAAHAVRLMLDLDSPERASVDLLLGATEVGDSAVIRLVLDGSRARIGLAATVDEVLMPTLRQVGAWWADGHCDMAQECLLTETARGWLARLTVLAPVLADEPLILLACGPRDTHTVGLEAIAALLAEQQRGSRVLGARTSELTLVSAATVGRARAVVMASQLPSHRRSTVQVMQAVARTGCPVFYAGNAFAFDRERRGVPGTYLGDNLTAARGIVLEALPIGTTRSRRPRRS